MRLGVCCKLENFEAVKNVGYDYCELNFTRLVSMEEDEFQEIKKASETLNLPVEAVNALFPGTMQLYEDDLEPVIAHLEKGMSRFAELGGTIAVLGSGGARKQPEHLSLEETEDKFVNLLKICGDIAKKYGVTIVIEPLNKKETNFINTVAEGLELCKRANHPNVKCLADFYHVFLENEPLEHIEAAGNDLKHVHIAVGEDRHIPNEADLEICKKWRDALDQCGYQGRISLEGIYKPDFETALRNFPIDIFR